MLFFSTSTLFSAPLLPKSACQPPASSLSISLSLSLVIIYYAFRP